MTSERAKTLILLSVIALVAVVGGSGSLGTGASKIVANRGGPVGPICSGPLRPDGNPVDVFDPGTNQCGPPSSPVLETLLDLRGRGSLRWTHDLVAGVYGFRWRVTAEDVACRARLVLDGPTGWDALDSSGSGTLDPRPGPIVLDDHGRVEPVASVEGGVLTISGDVPTGGISLDAGSSTVWLDTDCPGDSHVLVWHYFG